MEEPSLGMLDRLRKECAVIKGAPYSFLVAALLLGLVIWWALNWRYSSQIENLNSRNQLLAALNEDYEKKLNVSTPNEAERKLKDLQREIENLKDTTPRLEMKDDALWEEKSDGIWVVKITFHSATKLTPNGLLLSFDAEGIKSYPLWPTMIQILILEK